MRVIELGLIFHLICYILHKVSFRISSKGGGQNWTSIKFCGAQCNVQYHLIVGSGSPPPEMFWILGPLRLFLMRFWRNLVNFEILTPAYSLSINLFGNLVSKHTGHVWWCSTRLLYEFWLLKQQKNDVRRHPSHERPSISSAHPLMMDKSSLYHT